MLLRDINKIKQFIPVNATLDYEKLQPFLDDAERIIEDTISPEFYLILDTAVSQADGNEVTNMLIKKLQQSISYLAFHMGFDMLNTVFSNQGFHRIETEEGSKKALFQRQEENLKETFKTQGYNKLDIALEYMEKNKVSFPAWVASDAYTIYNSGFIKTAREFSSIYNIGNSRLAFIKLKTAIALTEDFDLLPLIGSEFFQELKLQNKEDSLTDANKTFLGYLKKALAYGAIQRGGVTMLFELNEYGFFQREVESNEKNLVKKTLVKAETFLSIVEQAQQTKQTYLKTCESFLKANIDNYPTFANSDAYNETGSVFNIKGTDKIGVI